MSLIKIKFTFFFIIVTIFLFNCKSAPNYKELKKEIDLRITDAQIHLKAGRIEEAYRIVEVIEDYEPNNEVIQSIKKQIESEKIDKKALTENSWLGFNKSQRAKERSVPLWKKIVFYLPDRVLDFFDIFSVSINTGPQYGAGVWITRGVQVNAFAGASVGTGYYQKRNIGGKIETSAELGVGPFSPTAIAGVRVGTNGQDNINGFDFLHKPSDELYKYYRDYWGVGAKVGVFILGIEFEIHPVEVFDFVAGIFLFDFGNDDLGSTRYLRYTPIQEYKIKSLHTKLRKYNAKDYKNTKI